MYCEICGDIIVESNHYENLCSECLDDLFICELGFITDSKSDEEFVLGYMFEKTGGIVGDESLHSY